MLAAVYNWFTEGFDTGDLKGAMALLDELRRLEPLSCRRSHTIAFRRV
jgi:hypothetical protein